MPFDATPQPTAPVHVILTCAQNVCLHAAALIEKYGHCKHQAGNFVVGFCAIGALAMAHRTIGDYRDDLCFSSVIGLLIDAVNHPFIPNWNDAPERTAEDVISALRRAAAINPTLNQELAHAV